jgi:hypothetical protein
MFCLVHAVKAFIDEAATSRGKIASTSISLAAVVYLVEKNRLPSSAYDDLMQALTLPSQVDGHLPSVPRPNSVHPLLACTA